MPDYYTDEYYDDIKGRLGGLAHSAREKAGGVAHGIKERVRPSREPVSQMSANDRLVDIEQVGNSRATAPGPYSEAVKRRGTGEGKPYSTEAERFAEEVATHE